MAESEERPKLRGPLAPLRLFLSSGKAMGRAGKSLAGRGLQKVKGRGSRPGPLASVSAAQFARAQPEETSREDNWWLPGIPNVALPEWLQSLGKPQRQQQQDSIHQLGRHCFPEQLSLRDGGATASTSGRQELVTVGSRQWGHPAISSLLRVKIYDFALYMDGQQAKESGVSKAYKGRLGNAALQEPSFYDALRSSDDVEMALVVRAARNLPIKLLAGEYERILKRRLARVGGSPDDAALDRMVTCFTEEALPESIKDGRSVRKGTVLTFTRDHEGNLAARADAHELVSVQSRPLCAAIFDLYIGEQPVSKKAKAVAGASFARLIESDESEAYRPPRDALVCAPGAHGTVCEL